MVRAKYGYICVCLCIICCPCVYARTGGGGLIGRWRHYGGSEKRGHVRPLSNGRHPRSTHPTSTLCLVIPLPRVTYCHPFRPIPNRLALSLRSSPFIPASSHHPMLPPPPPPPPPLCRHHQYCHYHAPNPYTR